MTSAAQLGIQGGSNGGLLVAACMVQRPELFGAVVCEVPLLDMSRYHLLHAGASWIDEYGDPDEPDEAARAGRLLAVSPRVGGGGLSAGAVHDIDGRRPRASRPRAQDGRAHAGAGCG